MNEERTQDPFTIRSLREQVTQLAFQWINLGYKREQIIRMVVAQGFGKKYAISVTAEAFEQLAEMYNE